jgi:Zn-dependent alcohol dehydrogenase
VNFGDAVLVVWGMNTSPDRSPVGWAATTAQTPEGAWAGAAAGHPPAGIVPVADGCSVALRNMPRLDAWMRKLDLPVNETVVPLMCLESAFFSPWLPAAACYRVSQVTMWLVALDVVLEDPGADVESSTARVMGWRRVIEGGPAASDDPMERSLAEICADLHREGRPELVDLWRETMQQTLTAMWFEREAAHSVARGEPPAARRYLHYGAWSIGVEQQVAALWALMDEPDLPRRLPVLRRALRHAATAVRLINDLQGHDREQAAMEVDAISIGLGADEVRRRFAESVEDCRLELAPLTAMAYGPAVALERALLWHARTYTRFDPVRPTVPGVRVEPADARQGTPRPANRQAPSPRSGRQMSIEQEILEIITSGQERGNETLAKFFDELEPVTEAYLRGSWRGGVFESGTDNVRQLEAIGWFGKRFVDADHVDPLLCRREDGTVYSFADMGLATTREVVFRGKGSTAMVYDQMPIIDHFRKISDDVALGCMDKKDDPVPFYFHMTRVPDPVTTADTTTATAAVLRSPDAPYVLEQVTIAEPGEGEIRVRIAGVGICHTEQALGRSEQSAPLLPMVLGHEGSGVVDAVGPGVRNIKPGDHVVLSFASCGDCANCRAAHPGYCDSFVPLNLSGRRLDGSTSTRDGDGEPVADRWFAQSSFATHALATARNAVVVDSSLPLEKLGPLGCGVQTGAGAVLRALRVPAGSSIAVLGTGTVGLSAAMAARAAGATTIVAVDLVDSRLALARELGATHTLRGDDENLTERIRSLSGGGVQFAVDTTGVPSVILKGIAALRVTGTMGLLGVQQGNLEIDSLALGLGKTLTGIIEGDSDPQEFIPQLIGLWRQGRFPFDRLITTYRLDQINEAEKAMIAGKAIKPVLLPGD